MVVKEVEDPSSFGVVEINDGIVTNIIEKPKLEDMFPFLDEKEMKELMIKDCEEIKC